MNRETAGDDPRKATTFAQFVRATATAYGDSVAVRAEAEGLPDESVTFTEIERQSAEIARGLIARGVGKGTRVGFIFANGPSFAIWLAAISRIGAVAIPISTMIRSNELVRVVRQSDISGLVIQRSMLGKDYVERLCEALPELQDGGPDLRIPATPYLRWVICPEGDLPDSMHDMGFLTDVADSVSEEMLSEIESEVHAADQMVEIYTSGSMALPKGVRHNHGPIMFRTHWLRDMIGQETGKEYPAIMPMFWVGGMMMYLLPNWSIGATTLCTERTLNNSRVAMGSVLADDDLEMMRKQPKPYWGLGMSETIGPYSYGDEVRAEGYPVCAPMDHWSAGYDVRIADDNNQPVADGETGEIQVRGYPVTPGLHKIERSEYFTPDGYYRTSDLGFVEGSRVHFVGRSGDMIKSAGSNVAPAEVEMEMQSLDSVHNAYVVGLPDRERGELVVAAVVAREGATLDFEAMEAELRKRLSSYKVPRAYLEFTREEVPLLHSNKVARREIAAMMKERLGRS